MYYQLAYHLQNTLFVSSIRYSSEGDLDAAVVAVTSAGPPILGCLQAEQAECLEA